MYKKPAFYIDMNSCGGCKTCMVACLDKMICLLKSTIVVSASMSVVTGVATETIA